LTLTIPAPVSLDRSLIVIYLALQGVFGQSGSLQGVLLRLCPYFRRRHTKNARIG